MRSVKVPKRAHKFRYLRNHNAKKRKAMQKTKANITNWISTAITERDQHKIQAKRPVSLSAVVRPKPSCSQAEPKLLIEQTTKSNGKAKNATVSATKPPNNPKPNANERPKASAKEKKIEHKKQKSGKGNKTSKQAEVNFSGDKTVETKETPLKTKETPSLQQNGSEEGIVEEPMDTSPILPEVNMTIHQNGSSADFQSESQLFPEKEMENESPAGEFAEGYYKYENGPHSPPPSPKKNDVESLSEYVSKDGTEELILDISGSGESLAPSAPLTKCSVDSGVDVHNGHNGMGNQNGINETSMTIESKEDSPVNGTTNGGHTETESIVTRFEKHVFELVNIINERLEQKTIAVSNISVSESLASPFVLEKAEPMERKREKKPRTYKLLPKDIEFCVYMMEKYGADYEGMSKDPKNMFHDPASMIARKLRIFRDSPHFEEYQQLKGNKA